MKKKARAWLIVAGVVVVVVLAVVAARMFIIRRPFPKTNGAVKVQGLHAPVEIYRDTDGVPHIYADNTDDLYFAQGYVHAQDRFWQINIKPEGGSLPYHALYVQFVAHQTD